MCSFYAYVYVFYDFTFCLSVLFSIFCKHVRLSCVFLNKLTLLYFTLCFLLMDQCMMDLWVVERVQQSWSQYIENFWG